MYKAGFPRPVVAWITTWEECRPSGRVLGCEGPSDSPCLGKFKDAWCAPWNHMSLEAS